MLFICMQVINAQSSRNQVVNTLNKYLQGSSCNDISKLKDAFSEDATLYLKGSNNQLQSITPDIYAGWFKNNPKGKFNGRIGRILSVNVQGDVASAQLEILMASRHVRYIRYIDLLLLAKRNNEWKIISKTASASKTNQLGQRVVFFVSNTHFYEGSTYGTGNSFSEIVNAYDEFVKAGYAVDFVSPKGGAVSLAYINTSDTLSKQYVYDPVFMHALQHTKKPSEILASAYKAVYYVGGGSAMFDVPVNNEMQSIAMEIYEKNDGIISAVCHGTAGLVNLKTSNGDYLVKGKRVNGYPEDYENTAKPHFNTFPFLIKKTIEERGGVFVFSERNSIHVEVDGRLVTGQNYISAQAVAQKIIELLGKK